LPTYFFIIVIFEIVLVCCSFSHYDIRCDTLN
jgi:hypothetical protein